jgi:hypothetical protein
MSQKKQPTLFKNTKKSMQPMDDMNVEDHDVAGSIL